MDPPIQLVISSVIMMVLCQWHHFAMHYHRCAHKGQYCARPRWMKVANQISTLPKTSAVGLKTIALQLWRSALLVLVATENGKLCRCMASLAFSEKCWCNQCL